jgi:hypothetical protein
VRVLDAYKRHCGDLDGVLFTTATGSQRDSTSGSRQAPVVKRTDGAARRARAASAAGRVTVRKLRHRFALESGRATA